jgi:hypothetical protein
MRTACWIQMKTEGTNAGTVFYKESYFINIIKEKIFPNSKIQTQLSLKLFG